MTDRSPAGIIARVAGLTTVTAVGIVAGTGIYLTLEYRPTGTGAPEALRHVHRWASYSVIGLAIVCVVALFVARTPGARRSRPARFVPGLTAVVAFVTATFGLLLPWDQLALRIVTVGTEFRGYRFLWQRPDDVLFILVGGSQVSTGTLSGVLGAHIVLGILVVAGAVTTLWFALSPRSAGPNGAPAVAEPG